MLESPPDALDQGPQIAPSACQICGNDAPAIFASKNGQKSWIFDYFDPSRGSIEGVDSLERTKFKIFIKIRCFHWLRAHMSRTL